MSSVTVGRVVIYVSPDGEHNWVPLDPKNVPTWLKDPNTLAGMLEGHVGHLVPGGVQHGSPEDTEPYYAAVTVPNVVTAGAMPVANDEPPDLPAIVMPTMKYITPDDGNVPAELRVPRATGEMENHDVELDAQLERHGISRYDMLGDGGNSVPQHPAETAIGNGLDQPAAPEGFTMRPKLEIVRSGPSPVPEAEPLEPGPYAKPAQPAAE